MQTAIRTILCLTLLSLLSITIFVQQKQIHQHQADYAALESDLSHVRTLYEKAKNRFSHPDPPISRRPAPGTLPALAAEANEQSLSIGLAAPAIDIEHWIQDGKGFFSPVTKMEKGKVYVVEFWATWCPPCVASMPHLASLQQKYRGRDVQIVSVSDEPLETVETFLKRETETAEGETTTYADIASAYCVTTDPDRSVYMAYMDASQQKGIPTAFIVGKSGLVEWVGHPTEMDEALEQVVMDKWDRYANRY